jgi:hypothetical protein
MARKGGKGTHIISPVDPRGKAAPTFEGRRAGGGRRGRVRRASRRQ